MGEIISIPWDALFTLSFYFLVIIYFCYTAVLYYHFDNYSMDNRASTLTYIAFFSLTVPLIAIMALAISFI